MSRNRSRRVRQSIADRLANAQAEAVRMRVAYEMTAGLAADQSRTISELKGILREATDIAGRMCIAFPADETLAVEWAKPQTRRHSKHERVRAHVPMTLDQCMALPTGDMEAAVAMMPVEMLPVLLSYVDQDALNRNIHALVQYSDKSAGYAISEKAIATLTHRELELRITRHIAPEIARELVSQLKGKKS